MPRLLSALLAVLVMVAPFSVDTYLPAFDAIGHALLASPIEMQQTLSSFLVGFAIMSLFHGALSDSLGRRPIVLGSLLVYALASAGGALSTDVQSFVFFRVLQGLSSGAGWVISSAVVRDVCAPNQAHKAMSRITLMAGVAPAVAPIVGGLLLTHLNWQAIFWFMTLLGGFLLAFSWCYLPETLSADLRQPFAWRSLLHGYGELAFNPRFLLVALANDLPFNGFFIYVACAPTFLGRHMHLQPTEFYMFFSALIAGVMVGSWVSGHLSARIKPRQLIEWGFAIMVFAALAQCLLMWQGAPQLAWALPLIGLFACGWAMMNPAMTLEALELSPHRKGMAASLLTFLLSASNAVVAGAVATCVMHSSLAMALVSLASASMGLLAWLLVRRRL